MASQLKKSHKIWKLSRDLGLRPSDDPVRDILAYCKKRVKAFLKDFPECKTLSSLLDCIAAKANTVFEVIRSDEDLEEIRSRYLKAGEKIFSTLKEELEDHVYGITFKRTNRESWQRQFVSIIDCRGDKVFRSYYTKWHEIAHLLVLTDQTRLSFRRTYHPENDPEEALIDVIAGEFGFYPPIVKKHKGDEVSDEISFEAIDNLREQLCPEASQQASLIGFVKTWPEPCLLLHCKEAYKKSEQEALSSQPSFDFQTTPTPALRAVKATLNEGARSIKFRIHPNMRVPEKSVIHEVFNGDDIYGEAEEKLSWWETSDGLRLPNKNITVKVKWIGHSLYALITPIQNT